MALLIATGIRVVHGATAIVILFAAHIATSVILLGIQSGVANPTAYETSSEPMPSVQNNPSAEASDTSPNESENVIADDPTLVPSENVDLMASGLELVASLASDSKGRIVFTELHSKEIWLLSPQADGTFEKSLLANISLPADLDLEHGVYQSSFNLDDSFLYVMATESTNLDVWAEDTSRVGC